MHKEAIRIAKIFPLQPEFLSSVYNNIGVVYSKLGESQTAQKYFAKSSSLKSEDDTAGNATNLNNARAILRPSTRSWIKWIVPFAAMAGLELRFAWTGWSKMRNARAN